jgi:hypothetical protein
MIHSAKQSITASDPPISIQANHQYLLTQQKLWQKGNNQSRELCSDSLYIINWSETFDIKKQIPESSNVAVCRDPLLFKIS